MALSVTFTALTAAINAANAAGNGNKNAAYIDSLISSIGSGYKITLRQTGGTAVSVPTPPSAVAANGWLRTTDQAPVTVPASFLGVHDDYISGVTYPTSTDAVLAHCGAVRSLNHDPNFRWYPALSWRQMELTEGVYTWTDMDAWVSRHTGKLLIYVLFGTPYFYAQYHSPWRDGDSAYNSQWHLYPSWRDSTSPPSDWTKAATFLAAVKARYSTENMIFELWNEANFGWVTDTGGAITEANRYTTRWSPEFQAVAGQGAPYFSGTATDLANGAKIIQQNTSLTLIGCGWEGQHSNPGVGNCMDRFSKAPTTGGGVGRDWLDGWSYHIYAYSGDMNVGVAEGKGYFAVADAAGYSQALPVHLTEIGHEGGTPAYSISDSQHTENVVRGTWIAAALGCKSISWYKLSSEYADESEAKNLKFFSAPSAGAQVNSNAACVAAFSQAKTVVGKTITQGALLEDNRVWLAFSDNTTAIY